MREYVLRIVTMMVLAMAAGMTCAADGGKGDGRRLTLTVVKLPHGISEAREIGDAMDSRGAEWHEIGCQNWRKDYPYKPEARFRIAHDGHNIYVEYRVKEDAVRAMNGADQSAVFQDACCEFFLMMDGEDTYYNIESNCIGAILMQSGRQGGSREEAAAAVLKSIKRWSSLGKGTFDTRIGVQEWRLSLIIPVSALFQSELKSLDGVTATGNFFKYGSRLPKRHFLSWNEVGQQGKPNFHQTARFGRIVFEGE